jgi:2-oxoglutarate dehydrogenase E2 component (dihydrolipoamide succinyltransferase)
VAKAQIKVPAVGESITEGTIANWTKKDGDYVKQGEVVMVLETDKASVEVVAENAGTISTKAKAGDVVKIGSVVGEIDTDGKPSAGAAKTAQAETSKEGKESPAQPPRPASNPPPAPQQNAGGGGLTRSNTMSPSVRRIVTENNLNPESIQGSGRGGRLTKGDVMHAEAGGGVSKEPAGASVSPISAFKAPASKPSLGEEITREPMSTIRKRIAQRLVEAQSTAAILTTFNEIDMTEVMALRTKYKEKFEKKYGIGLGFMGFFVKAVIEALRAYPKVNAFIEGNDIVYHNYQNIGVAVGTEKGLMVPVLKHAEHMSLAEIEMTIKAYAQKARDGKISIDDLNGGTYGSLMSTPILNPPQSGILGMHKIEERPVAKNGQVVIRPMMYVAFSYDHRVIDGSESVSFLVRVKDCIEDPSRLLLEI